MLGFNLLDWLLLIAIVLWVIRGYVRGFISQLVSLVGLFVAFLAAYFLYDEVAVIVAKIIPITAWHKYEEYELFINILNLDAYFYNAIAFGVIFFAVKIGLSIVAYVLNIIAKAPVLNMINKLTGLALAVIEAAIILVIIINVMSAIPNDTTQSLLANSSIAQYILTKMPLLVDYFHRLLAN